MTAVGDIENFRRVEKREKKAKKKRKHGRKGKVLNCCWGKNKMVKEKV